MTSPKFLWLLRDFVPEYHHAKFGCKGDTRGHNVPAYMVPKDPSLNRVKVRYYGGSASSYYRTASAISQFNERHDYLVQASGILKYKTCLGVLERYVGKHSLESQTA